MPQRERRNPPTRYASGKALRQLAFFLVIDFLVVTTILLALHNITYSNANQANATAHQISIITIPVTTVAVPSNVLVLGPQVLNITLNITNDEIVGRMGYWALANYTRTIKGYRILSANNTYFLIISLNGTWRTFAGALSPGNGIVEPANGSGTFLIRYSAIEPYPLNNSAQLYGSLGNFNLNGSANDIVKGMYANQTGISPSSFQWTRRYFGFIGGLNITKNYTGVFSLGNQSYSIIINQTGERAKGDILT